MEIVFATTNAAKLAQLRFVADSLGYAVTVVPAQERYGEAAEYEEVGQTVQAIARQGALEVAARLGVPVLTEDTGLFVAALDGQPGIRAGRFLKEQGRAGMLATLAAFASPEERRAEVVSALCYATPEGRGLLLERTVTGHIADQERWGPYPAWIAPQAPSSAGGGFNALFVPAGETRTLAEIPPEEALGWSYRERNFQELLEQLAAGVYLDAL
jgi:XTP/dITP diphosphohydrolase